MIWHKHHGHFMGAVAHARCGEPILWEWECCICGKRKTCRYNLLAPDGWHRSEDGASWKAHLVALNKARSQA